MKGGEGTGKGTLAKVILHITGHHRLAISNPKHLTGAFNAHLRDAVFLFADEALFAGDRSHVGALKSLITEPYLTVEAKFQNAVQSPNFLHVMMASNEEWVVPAAHDARRFFVLEVSDLVKGNHGYFSELWAQLEAGGYTAMLYDLLAMDLTSFNVRAVPTTEGLQRQRSQVSAQPKRGGSTAWNGVTYSNLSWGSTMSSAVGQTLSGWSCCSPATPSSQRGGPKGGPCPARTWGGL